MELLRKYGVQTDIYFPVIDAGTNDFGGSGDYTYAAGDIKISKDGGAAANPTNSPSFITMGNASKMKLTLTATEMQAALISVTLSDAATKAVEDQMILIATYGNASAQHAVDLDDAVRAGLTALPNANAEAAGGLATSSGGGLDLDDLALADKLLAYVQLMLRKDSEIKTDRTTEHGEINADQGSGPGTYDSQADSQESMKDNLPGDIDTELTSSHGSGSWAGSSSDIVVATGAVAASPTPAADEFGTDLTLADDRINFLLLLMTSGTYKDESRWIEVYANTNGLITLSESLSGAPAATDTFKVFAFRSLPMALERSN